MPGTYVVAVTGDDFFNQEMIEEFGYANAKFITDWFHLFNSGLEQRFGKYCHQLLESHHHAHGVGERSAVRREGRRDAREALALAGLDPVRRGRLGGAEAAAEVGP